MFNDNLLSPSFPTVQRKKITVAFHGGRIVSDGVVLLLASAERRLGIAKRKRFRRGLSRPNPRLSD